MDTALKKIIDLVRRTGDKCIILDEKQSPYVLLKLSDYEKLVGQQPSWEPVTRLTESELLDKINRDIAVWRSSQEPDEDEVAINIEKDLANDWNDRHDDYPKSAGEELSYGPFKSDEIPF